MQPVPSAEAADHHDSASHASNVRVVFIANTFLPLVGGIEVLSLREAVALRNLGVRTRIVTLRLDRRLPVGEEMDGVEVRRTGGIFVRGKLRLRLGAQWAAEAALFLHLMRHRHEYDLIHMRQLSFLARPVALAALLTRKPVVVQLASAGPGRESPVRIGAATTLHAGPLDPNTPYLRIAAGSWGAYDVDTLRRSQWLAPLTLRLLRRPRVVFLAVSERTRTHLVEDGVRAEQIVLLPTGIEPERYTAASARLESRWHAELRTAPTVLCVARYRFQKGLDFLLHAWRSVREQIPNARLVLAGGGPLHAPLAQMAQALDLAESVEFAGLREDVDALLAEADVFVLASRYEGLPNALLEAMAVGLPVVATRVSGNEDVVVDGQTGWLVPAYDPQALADAIVAVLASPREAHARGSAGRARVWASYRRDQLMRRLVGLYEELTAGLLSPDGGEPTPTGGAPSPVVALDASPQHQTRRNA